MGAPLTTLRFRYLGGHPITMNKAWVDRMRDMINTPAGLHLIDEPNGP